MASAENAGNPRLFVQTNHGALELVESGALQVRFTSNDRVELRIGASQRYSLMLTLASRRESSDGVAPLDLQIRPIAGSAVIVALGAERNRGLPGSVEFAIVAGMPEALGSRLDSTRFAVAIDDMNVVELSFERERQVAFLRVNLKHRGTPAPGIPFQRLQLAITVSAANLIVFRFEPVGAIRMPGH